jgi:hypothetical protein
MPLIASLSLIAERNRHINVPDLYGFPTVFQVLLGFERLDREIAMKTTVYN